MKPKPTKFEDLTRDLQGVVVDYALCSRPGPDCRTSVAVVTKAVSTVVEMGDAHGRAPLTIEEIAQLRAIIDRRFAGYEPEMRLRQYQTCSALMGLAYVIKRFAARTQCWKEWF